MATIPSVTLSALPPILSQFLQDPATTPEETQLAREDRDTTHAVYQLTRRLLSPHERAKKLWEIRQRFQQQIEEMLQTAWSNPEKREEIKAQLMPLGALGRSYLLEMYQNGASSFNWYMYHMGLCEGKGLNTLAEEWLGRVREDVHRGELHALPQMAAWIKSRHIYGVRSLSKEPPFHGPNAFMPLLQKMRALGVLEAQSALCIGYMLNEMGDDKDEMRLGFSKEERIRGLQELAFQGCLGSQLALSKIYFENRLSYRDSLSLSEEARREGIQQLIRMESPSKPNEVITRVFAENRIGELPCHYSLHARITHLTEKAQLGDGMAFAYLKRLYTKNKLDKQRVKLRLTSEEMAVALQALKTPHNEKKFFEWRRPSLPRRERTLAYLEREFFENQNASVIDELVTCYQKNMWGQSRLRLPFQERVEKLQRIAAHVEGESAFRPLISLYIDKRVLETRKNFIMDLAFTGKHWGVLYHQLTRYMSDPSLKKIVKLAHVHMEVLDWYAPFNSYLGDTA